MGVHEGSRPRSGSKSLDGVPMACYAGKGEGDLLAVSDSVAPSPGNNQQASGTPSRPADVVAGCEKHAE